MTLQKKAVWREIQTFNPNRIKMKNINIILSILLFTIMGTFANAQSQNKSGKEKSVHIVLFKFKAYASPEKIQNLKNEISKQKGTVPGLLEISFGEDFTGRTKGFTHAEVAIFEDRKSLETFNKSNYHQQLVANHIKPLLEEILVLDYEMTSPK